MWVQAKILLQSADLTLSRLLHELLIINKYYLSIQNFKCLKSINLKALVLNVGKRFVIFYNNQVML